MSHAQQTVLGEESVSRVKLREKANKLSEAAAAVTIVKTHAEEITETKESRNSSSEKARAILGNTSSDAAKNNDKVDKELAATMPVKQEVNGNIRSLLANTLSIQQQLSSQEQSS